MFQDDIDIELSGDSSEETGGAGGSKDQLPRKETQDPKQSVQVLLQRQAKFLESCREVKVR